jgi:hypothetical protein
MSVEKKGGAQINPNVGVLLSRVNIEVLYDIADIYNQIVGGLLAQLRSYDPQEVMDYVKQLQRTNFIAWRFGSKLPEDKDQSGKLGIWEVPKSADGCLIRFEYEPNALEGTPAAEALRKEFRSAVASYLVKSDLATQLPDK